jgi:hypothetical protein
MGVLMDTDTGGESLQTKQKKHHRWIFSGFLKKGVRYALVLSLIIFGLYSAGSIPDPGFSDRTLFLLLQMLRYVSLLLCVFSLFSLGFRVRRFVHHPHLHNIPGILFYFAIGMLGAFLAMLNSLIIVTTGGYG